MFKTTKKRKKWTTEELNELQETINFKYHVDNFKVSHLSRLLGVSMPKVNSFLLPRAEWAKGFYGEVNHVG